MKYIILDQAKIEGEKEIEVLKMGKIAIDPEHIVSFHNLFDKYDCIIKNVTIITLRSNADYSVFIEFSKLLEELQQHISM